MNRRTTTRQSQQPTTEAAKNDTSVVTVPPRKSPTSRGAPPCKHKQVVSANVLFFILLLLIAGIYSVVVYAFYVGEEAGNHSNNNNNNVGPAVEKQQRRMRGTTQTPDVKKNHEEVRRYPYWRELAVQLATMSAKEALRELNEKDPFGTRHFEQALLDEETRLGRLLEHHEIEALFPCPSSSRITLPDQRNLVKAREFRDNKPGTFLFFQHLRKAGGTHFCSLAKANLPKNNVAAYYCMPDMEWSGGKHGGYLHSYSNEELVRRATAGHDRVMGNEWDWFRRTDGEDDHFNLPAVFATSFRKPLDRALSQFRFECIEDRGCKIKDVHEFWDKRVDLYNVYTQTFADTPKFFGKLQKAYLDKVEGASQKRADMMGKALDTVAKFNLVLAMEFLAYAGPLVDRVLGFHDTSVLTQRVRPHIKQFARNDGQEVNKLGAAGITKASWDPEKYLDAAQYQKMSELLALDMILTDAARRMFLERLVCTDLSE